MKTLIFIMLLSSTNIYASSDDECLNFMVNRDKAEIIMKKQCKVIIRDYGQSQVTSIDACFTKIKNQFPGKISYGLSAKIQKKHGFAKRDSIIVNTAKAIENDRQIKIDIKTGSPELLTFYRNSIVFDKDTNSLFIKEDRRGIFSNFKNIYNLELQCDGAY